MLGAVGYFGFFLRYGSQELAPSLTYTGLISLRPGMERDQVIEAVGRPLYVEEREDAESWVYVRPCGWRGSSCRESFSEGLELSLLMREGRLMSGYAEFGDLLAWSCNEDACPRWVDEAVLRRILPGA